MALGAAGFAGEHDSELELALGYVMGVRQWSRDHSGRLQGVHNFVWADGENIAACDGDHRPPHSADSAKMQQLVKRRDALFAETQRMGTSHPRGISALCPADRKRYDALFAEYEKAGTELTSSPAFTDCGCGFYAYWELNPAEYRMGDKPICGVIKGYGKVLLGTRGFRCEKAQIVGLHLAYEYIKPVKPEPGKETDPADWAEMFANSYEVNSAQAVAKMARDEAELAEVYPGAEVFTTLDAMLKKFPPSKEAVAG